MKEVNISSYLIGDPLPRDCRGGVVAQAQCMVSRSDAILILRNSANLYTVFQLRPSTREMDKKQVSQLRFRLTSQGYVQVMSTLAKAKQTQQNSPM